MKPIHVGTSPITGRIYAGHVLADGQTWGAGRTDVTGAACGAVAEHVRQHGGPVVVTCNGQPHFEIAVLELDGKLDGKQDDGLSVNLQPGRLYDFHIKGWQAPTGETIPAEIKRREFRRLLLRGVAGQPQDPFVEVVHQESGRVHLIALETIERAEMSIAEQRPEQAKDKP